jgi:hypothetical protein
MYFLGCLSFDMFCGGNLKSMYSYASTIWLMMLVDTSIQMMS